MMNVCRSAAVALALFGTGFAGAAPAARSARALAHRITAPMRADAPPSPVLGPGAPDGEMGGSIPSALPGWSSGEPTGLGGDRVAVTGKLVGSPVLGPPAPESGAGGVFPSVLPGWEPDLHNPT